MSGCTCPGGGGLQVEVASAVGDLRVPSKVGNPRGKDVSGSGGGGVSPLNPVIPGIGVRSDSEARYSGETNDIVNLEAGGISSENGVALEVLGGAVVLCQDSLLNGSDSKGGCG